LGEPSVGGGIPRDSAETPMNTIEILLLINVPPTWHGVAAQVPA
jgi:hypothetical protein